MNIFNKVVGSIKKKGLIKTIQLILCIIFDHWFDVRYGTNTMRNVELDDLEIKSENKDRGVKYQPTMAMPFKKLMNTLDFPSGSIFVDLGAGKGRTLLMASAYGFKRIVGVEFSHELCQEAKKNLSIYRKKTGIDVDVKIVECDVVDYEIEENENVFFVFNPFDAVVMSNVLSNINRSLKKNPRKIWFIYNDPVYRDIIERQGNFLKLAEYMIIGNQFIVYVNSD